MEETTPAGLSDSEDEDAIFALLAGSAEAEEQPKPPEEPPEVAPPAEAVPVAASANVSCHVQQADTGGRAEACGCGSKPSVSSAAVPEASTARSSAPVRRTRGAGNRVPQEILDDPELKAAVRRALPRNHEFEVPRCVWRLRKAGVSHVALQLPDGLIAFGPVLGEIFRHFCPTVRAVTVLADATFGACCIDDLTCRAMNVQFLIHYGHSCLVPTDQTTVVTLYIHVTVEVNTEHLVETVQLNFKPQQKLAFLGSVQFAAPMQAAVELLNEAYFASPAEIPQVRPLGAGETLGCTSPVLGTDVDAVVFVCDGRFHLESAMIQNPHIPGGFYRYDPYIQTLTIEGFAHGSLHRERHAAIEVARNASCVGLILGTLGRQGSVGVLEGVERCLEERGIEHFTLLLSEVLPEKLAKFENVDAWVQAACPRLSMDWGGAYTKPLLTPYEAHVAFGQEVYRDVYPMDYYSNKGGSWTNYGAKKGYGGSVGEKFTAMRQKARPSVGYDSS